MDDFPSIPGIHRDFLRSSVEKLKDDERILGVAGGGSLILGRMDEFSDLDLVVVVDPDSYQEILADRKTIAGSIGPLLEAFTGEHVGEPRLLICLYGPPLLHIDLKFVSLEDAGKRVEDPVIIWERGSMLTEHLLKGTATYPEPNLTWIEERFWVWVHYMACKIGRGELFEAVDGLSFLRGQVLGPMILLAAGARPQGVRRIEEYGGPYLEKLQQTIPMYERMSCLRAMQAAIGLYQELREKLHQKGATKRVEVEAIRYLDEIEARLRER